MAKAKTDRTLPVVSLDGIEPDNPITLPVIGDFDSYQISKSNKLIEGQANLSARQQKILGACIALINPKDSYPNGMTVELTDEHIETLTGIPKRTIPRFIDAAAKAFHSIPIETPGKQPGTIDYINIAHRSKYNPEERVFRITFHSEMEEELLNLPEYTRYALRYLVALNSKYSIRLFELLSKFWDQRRPGPQYWRVKITDLYYPLGLIDINGVSLAKSYTKSVGEFRRRVLDPALDDINANTEFDIEVTTYRTGRTIGGYTFKLNHSPAPRFKVGSNATSMEVSDKEITSILKDIGVLPPVIDRWLVQYSNNVIADNVAYMGALDQDGMEIRSPSAFLNVLLLNNVAHLPSVANPYSSIYSESPWAREFVKRVGSKVWWKLSQELQESIVTMGGFTNHPTTLDDYRMFEHYAKTSTMDEAVMMFDINALAEDWNAKAPEKTILPDDLFDER
tara:strand:+ start:260 stop:1615 length:1356 start_codon:yes stop_codon:yes gene_type:complete